MVDYRKRVEEAASGMLSPVERVLAGVNVTESPFRMAGAGATAGRIVGGAVGAVVGAIADRRRDKKESEREAVRAVPELATRPEVEPPVPAAGGLIGVTTDRVLLWSISAMGKPKDLVLQVPLHDVDSVVWQRLPPARMAGRPASIIIWVGLGTRVLSMAAVDIGAAARHADMVVAALAERRPGRVREFAPEKSHQ